MTEKLYSKGERVTCTNGHLIGFISKDLFKNNGMCVTDVLGFNGEALHSHQVDISKYKCPECGAMYMNARGYCIAGVWR